MFEVKVTVELPGIPEALNTLARAITESGVSAAVKSLAPAVADGNKPAPAPAVSAPVKQTVPAPAPVEQPVPAPAPVAQQTADSAPTITMNDLSKAGAALVEAGKMDAVINLLKQFGAVAITQLKEDQYASFAASLRGLGANI